MSERQHICNSAWTEDIVKPACFILETVGSGIEELFYYAIAFPPNIVYNDLTGT